MAEDFHVNLATPEGGRRAEDMATTLVTEGLKYMANFLPAAGEQVVSGSEDVGDALKGKGGAFLE